MKKIVRLMLCFLGLGIAVDNQTDALPNTWLSADLAGFDVEIHPRQTRYRYQVGEPIQFVECVPRTTQCQYKPKPLMNIHGRWPNARPLWCMKCTSHQSL